MWTHHKPMEDLLGFPMWIPNNSIPWLPFYLFLIQFPKNTFFQTLNSLISSTKDPFLHHSYNTGIVTSSQHGNLGWNEKSSQ